MATSQGQVLRPDPLSSLSEPEAQANWPSGSSGHPNKDGGGLKSHRLGPRKTVTAILPQRRMRKRFTNASNPGPMLVTDLDEALKLCRTQFSVCSVVLPVHLLA